MKINVREARLEDAAEIARIHVVSSQIAYRGILPDAWLSTFSIPKRTAQWEQWLRDAPLGKFVVEFNGTVAGWVSVGRCRDEDRKSDVGAGELYAIYVDPPLWWKGLGSLLNARAERELIVQQFRTISLWVLEANPAARAFYEKHGYRADGAKKNALREGAAIPELRYAKKIRAES